MVEVFKTNVEEAAHAGMLIHFIQKAFPDYKANFDLDDCDRILRIRTIAGAVESGPVINLLEHLGFHAMVLPDEPINVKATTRTLTL